LHIFTQTLEAGRRLTKNKGGVEDLAVNAFIFHWADPQGLGALEI
jgi:hypothetical protein